MDYNDFELVSLAREHNEEATRTIYDKYKPIIIRKANDLYKMVSYNVEINDLIQEGYIGLDNAISNFRERDNVTFYTFACLCIERKIISYIRKFHNKKQKVLNEAIVIDEGMERLLRDSTDIENDFINKEDDKDIIDRLKNELSDTEKNVLEDKLKGYNNSEIAKKLNKDTKFIYNTLDRIKNKLKSLIQDN